MLQGATLIGSNGYIRYLPCGLHGGSVLRYMSLKYAAKAADPTFITSSQLNPCANSNTGRMRSILFVLLAAFSFSAHAQLAEWADQRSEEIYFDHALPAGGGRWAVIGRTSFGASNMISVRNGDGTIAWEQIDTYSTGQGAGEVVVLPDSGFLHVGVYDGCDYIRA